MSWPGSIEATRSAVRDTSSGWPPPPASPVAARRSPSPIATAAQLIGAWRPRSASAVTSPPEPFEAASPAGARGSRLNDSGPRFETTMRRPSVPRSSRRSAWRPSVTSVPTAPTRRAGGPFHRLGRARSYGHTQFARAGGSPSPERSPDRPRGLPDDVEERPRIEPQDDRQRGRRGQATPEQATVAERRGLRLGLAHEHEIGRAHV